MKPQTKLSLSPARQKLLELMQQLNFCRLENLHVCNGEPQFEPAPTLIQHLKIGGDTGPKVQMYLKDYVLKQAQVELFQHLDELGSGVVTELEVRGGLPQHLKIKRSVA